MEKDLFEPSSMEFREETLEGNTAEQVSESEYYGGGGRDSTSFFFFNGNWLNFDTRQIIKLWLKKLQIFQNVTEEPQVRKYKYRCYKYQHGYSFVWYWYRLCYQRRHFSYSLLENNQHNPCVDFVLLFYIRQRLKGHIWKSSFSQPLILLKI